MFVKAPASSTEFVAVVNTFSKRQIKYAFHDIDGTHPLTRDQVPVMTLVAGAAKQRAIHRQIGTNIVAEDYRHIGELFEL